MYQQNLGGGDRPTCPPVPTALCKRTEEAGLKSITVWAFEIEKRTSTGALLSSSNEVEINYVAV